jgi:membrane protein implicated in regulation of membrane protease activity
METVFLVCAAVGGVILLCQLVMTLAGVGGDHDISADHAPDFGTGHDMAGGHATDHHIDHGASWFFHVLSFRAICAAVTFFGLGGLAAAASPSFSTLSFPIGLASGLLAMVVVGWLMGLLSNLQAEGTVRIERTVGTSAVVYLTIPPAGEGAGKVTVKVQDRTMEYRAVTQEKQTFKTGDTVLVVGVLQPDTLEVAPVRE